MVDDRNTKYGPNMAFTKGNGMAAASSITTSSAWVNFLPSDGWMYWKMKKYIYLLIIHLHRSLK